MIGETNSRSNSNILNPEDTKGGGNNLATYVRLLDFPNTGTIMMLEGRIQYIFILGRGWVRSAYKLKYQHPDSENKDDCEEITEEEARAITDRLRGTTQSEYLDSIRKKRYGAKSKDDETLRREEETRFAEMTSQKDLALQEWLFDMKDRMTKPRIIEQIKSKSSQNLNSISETESFQSYRKESLRLGSDSRMNRPSTSKRGFL
jgi:hypothetical protein